MKNQDEFYWPEYTKEYSRQLEEIKNNDKQDFFLGGNLHNNWREIYSVVEKLKPESVFECGCGGCYHLKNIRQILPHAKIAGCDLLLTQLKYGKDFSNITENDKIDVFQYDMTIGFNENNFAKYEFVYSHAVVMHLSTANAVHFMKNMERISSRYIFMVEGVRNHEDWYGFVKRTLPNWNFSMSTNFIDNGILLTKY